MVHRRRLAILVRQVGDLFEIGSRLFMFYRPLQSIGSDRLLVVG